MLIEAHLFTLNKKRIILSIVLALVAVTLAGRPIDVFASDKDQEGVYLEESSSEEEYSDEESSEEYSQEGIYYEDTAIEDSEESPIEDSEEGKYYEDSKGHSEDNEENTPHQNEVESEPDEDDIKAQEAVKKAEEAAIKAKMEAEKAAEEARIQAEKIRQEAEATAKAESEKYAVEAEKIRLEAEKRIEEEKQRIETAKKPVEESKIPIIVEKPAEEPRILAQEKLEKPVSEQKFYTEQEAIELAKVIEVEVRGGTDTEKSKVAWCVLNRVDNGGFGNGIMGVISHPGAFAYRPGAHYTAQSYKIAKDVLNRWNNEKNNHYSEGRTLPRSYLYFAGDGKLNHFRTGISGSSTKYNNYLGTPY